jgi:pSer/pThr/pTyr-binding forkhead associated (FHA) protein
MIASVEVQTVLLVLKICFLVLLYLFIWRIVRSASRDVRMPQESFILAPSQAAALGLGRQTPNGATGALVATRSTALEEGERFELDTKTLTIGRGTPNDIRLDEDEFVSTHHARIDPRRDGVWVEDIGSTNGTFVNGMRLDRPQRLTPGDIVRIGDTDLRYER